MTTGNFDNEVRSALRFSISQSKRMGLEFRDLLAAVDQVRTLTLNEFAHHLRSHGSIHDFWDAFGSMNLAQRIYFKLLRFERLFQHIRVNSTNR